MVWLKEAIAHVVGWIGWGLFWYGVVNELPLQSSKFIASGIAVMLTVIIFRLLYD